MAERKSISLDDYMAREGIKPSDLCAFHDDDSACPEVQAAAAELRAAWEWWEQQLHGEARMFVDGWNAAIFDDDGDESIQAYPYPTRVDAIVALWRKVVRP